MRCLELKHFEDMHGGRLRGNRFVGGKSTRDAFGGMGGP
jgi:hypothetical protein